LTDFVSIGIVSFSDQKYLQKTLPKIVEQNFEKFEILFFDNNSDYRIRNWVKKKFPIIKIFGFKKNIGFGTAHNFLIQKSQGKFYWAVNSDFFPQKDFLQKIIPVMKKNKKIASASGKILQWKNFPKIPDTKICSKIDSTGLKFFPNFSVQDRGNNQNVKNFQNQSEIFGAGGVAPVFRISALHKISQNNKFFEENFFAYFEDVDLALRFRWGGFSAIFIPTAVGFHDRSFFTKKSFYQQFWNRKKRSRFLRAESFANYFLMITKNFSSDFSFQFLLKNYFFRAKYFCFLFFFEPLVFFTGLRKILKFRKIFQEKNKKIIRQISPEKMEEIIKNID